jgi:hypothetical protein
MTSVVFIDLDLAALTRQNPDGAFPSRRGYHLTRRSFRRTEGRRRSDGEAPRPSATGEGCPDVDQCPSRYKIRHLLRGRPTLHPDGCSSSCFSSSSMPSRMKDEAFLYLVYGTTSLIQSHVA